MKKIESVILSMVMIISLIAVAPESTEAAVIGKVTVSIEKLTIGQGLFGEPAQITIYSGDTVKSVIDRYMNNYSYNYRYSNTGGWYLTAVENGDASGVANIPDVIANIPETFQLTYYGDDKLTHVRSYSAPSSNKNLGNKDTTLGEGDYGVMSGWVFTVNNRAVFSGGTFNKEDGNPATDPTVRNLYKGADKVSVKNGDVIRVMFTVFGYGADVGIDTYADTGIKKISLADKTELLRTVSDINAKKSYWTVYPNVKSAYDQAVSVISSYNPSQSVIGSATTQLRNAMKSPQNPAVGAAKIYTAKNVKGSKIKITAYKMTGITGYQIRYGNNKKLKNKKKKKWKAVSVRTRKRIYTTKKIKNIKKKRAYIKIRAYRIVNGKYVYGKWTGVKKVKMKK